MRKDRFTRRALKNGVVRLSVDLKPGEAVMLIEPDHHYRLGGQMEDVVPAHVLEETVPVSWSHFEQKWIE